MRRKILALATIIVLGTGGAGTAQDWDWVTTKTIPELNELVKDYYAAGHDDSALMLAKRTVKEASARFGERSDMTAISVNSQATLLYNMGYPVAAESLFERAADIWAEVPPADTMILGATFYNLGVLYKDTQRFRLSKFAHRKAQEFLTPRMEPNNRILANILIDLGDIYREEGLYDSAAEAYRDALPRLRATLPKHSLPIAQTLNNLGIALSNLGQYEAAERAYNDALLSMERILGSDDIEIGYCIQNLATLHGRRGRPADAVRLAILAQQIFDKQLGRTSVEAIEMLYLQGRAHLQSKAYDEAETALTEAQKRLSGQPAAETTEIQRQVLSALADLYKATGNDSELQEVRTALLGLSEE